MHGDSQRRTGKPGPGKADCRYLLELPTDSLEIEVVRSVANTVARCRFNNEAILLGQIGIDAFPCPGKCGFCAFGEGHTGFTESYLSLDEFFSARTPSRTAMTCLRSS